MITFMGGPAGHAFKLVKRAPAFLRIARGPFGFRPLAEVEDAPEAEEKEISVYRRSGPAGEKDYGFHGVCKIAVYVFHSSQPDDSITRDAAAWQDWCRANHKTPQ